MANGYDKIGLLYGVAAFVAGVVISTLLFVIGGPTSEFATDNVAMFRNAYSMSDLDIGAHLFYNAQFIEIYNTSWSEMYLKHGFKYENLFMLTPTFVLTGAMLLYRKSVDFSPSDIKEAARLASPLYGGYVGMLVIGTYLFKSKGSVDGYLKPVISYEIVLVPLISIIVAFLVSGLIIRATENTAVIQN